MDYEVVTPQTNRPEVFKGIALFTPGGDLVYCLDPHKQTRWHLQLCAVLQELLGLAEPPHFLVPCYSATIDRWIDPYTQQLKTAAEACPAVLENQVLLNAVFGVDDLVWARSPLPEGVCDPSVLSVYRTQFPQLWENHDLIFRFDQEKVIGASNGSLSWLPKSNKPDAKGYVLRLYISGNSAATEHTLQTLHQILERSLKQPYTLKIVDTHKNPEQAELDQIAATPTLVKVWPPPVRRIVGDFENLGKLLQFLAPLDN